MKLVILYGTETGNAEACAERVAEVLTVRGETAVSDLSEFPAGQVDPDDFYVFVTSTYGEGELPGNAQTFFDTLDGLSPDLDGVRFAVFGLGDSYYETFNRGGEIVVEKLSALGAERVGVHARHDASSGEAPEDLAEEWAQGLIALLADTVPAN